MDENYLGRGAFGFFNAGGGKINGVYHSCLAGANCYPLSLSMRGSSMEKYDIQVTGKVSVYMFLGETAPYGTLHRQMGAQLLQARVSNRRPVEN